MQFLGFAYFPALNTECAFASEIRTVSGELFENLRYGPVGVLRHILFPWISAALVAI